MATTTNILVLLKFFASKQNSPLVDFFEFCDYLKKYSEHHLGEQPSLQVYLEKTEEALQKELDKYSETKQIIQNDGANGKKTIYVVQYVIEKTAEKYKDIAINPSIPFPAESDLAKNTPKSIIIKEEAADLIAKLLSTPPVENDRLLYGLILPQDAPTILLPSSVSVVSLIETSILKLQTFLKKEDRHDYFLKKLTMSNPGKELTTKNFFNGFVDRPDHGIEILKDTTDNFYLWHQMCHFIKQDYGKVKDFTQEDLSTLQSVFLIEIASNYFKSKNQTETKKVNALKALEQILNKPPYYFTFEAITKFSDKNGVPLLGQYSEDDLKAYLHEKTTDGSNHELPELLVFKTSNEERFFICKSKVLQLIIMLCTDARTSVREVIKSEWTNALKNFDILPEMQNQEAFESRLENEVAIQSPILHALLSSSFLQLLSYDTSGGGERVTLFDNGALLPYSELLLMNRNELLTDSKILLPFWYTLPVISWIARLFLRPPKSKRGKRAKSKAQAYREEEEEKRLEDEEAEKFTNNPTVSKRVAIKNAARDAEAALVPESSTLDREIESYHNIWNKIIEPTAANNLTEDVNVLIRDYVRKIIRTMKTKDFSTERIKSIADSLVKSPALQKINEHDALEMYIQLYIIKLVKNISVV
ncbi:MAG: hypothetical protein II921_03670 [Treponema sp.]|nr:hypothetical protein [Treponema sp.]